MGGAMARIGTALLGFLVCVAAAASSAPMEEDPMEEANIMLKQMGMAASQPTDLGESNVQGLGRWKSGKPQALSPSPRPTQSRRKTRRRARQTARNRSVQTTTDQRFAITKISSATMKRIRTPFVSNVHRRVVSAQSSPQMAIAKMPLANVNPKRSIARLQMSKLYAKRHAENAKDQLQVVATPASNDSRRFETKRRGGRPAPADCRPGTIRA